MAAAKDTLLKLAELSFKAEEEKRSIEQFKKKYPDLTENDGYEGQKLRLEMALAKGHKVIGMKLGNTSMAKMNQVRQTMLTEGAKMNTDPSFGFLFDYMRLAADENLKFDQLIHPKIESELAFVLGKELYGPHITAPDVMAATAYVSPAFEIIDSRFDDFKIGGIADVLLDNVSSARFKLSESKMEPCSLDLVNMAVRTNVNGEYVAFGAGGSVMGHPARAVAALVRLMYEKMDKPLPAGSVVLSGAIIPSSWLHKGDSIQSDFGGLGSISLRVI